MTTEQKHTPDIGLPESGAAYWAERIASTKSGSWQRSEAEQGHAGAVALAIAERDALRAKVERLREALAGCVKQCADYESMTDDCAAAFRKANAALGAGK